MQCADDYERDDGYEEWMSEMSREPEPHPWEDDDDRPEPRGLGASELHALFLAEFRRTAVELGRPGSREERDAWQARVEDEGRVFVQPYNAARMCYALSA